VDQALRARVDKFFQAHVDGKFRVADAVVAEDSKDYYFESQKPRYLSYKIDSIEYSDNFTRAKVKTICETKSAMPGFGRLTMEMPRITTWKVENGEWFWYHDPALVSRNAWAKPRDPSKAPAPAAQPAAPAARQIDVSKGPSPQELKSKSGVRPDKTSVVLGPDHPSDEVVFTNSLPGYVTLTVRAPKGGAVKAAFDRRDVGPRETARLRLEYQPSGDAPHGQERVLVGVQPIGKPVTITVKYDQPKEQKP
jgi:hypothetical protein